MSSASKVSVLEVGFRSATIQKHHADKDYVAEVIAFPAKWEGESIKEFSELLAAILLEKKNKLEDVHDPIILLLLDSFRYVKESHWREAILGLEDRHVFLLSAAYAHRPGPQLYG